MNKDHEKMERYEDENVDLLVRMEAMSSQITGVQPPRFRASVNSMQSLGDITPTANLAGVLSWEWG